MPYNNFLMRSYPKISRNLEERKNNINNKIKNIARKFDKDFLMEKEFMDMEDINMMEDGNR